jgi:thiol-disulfide isomerase/thioredoxin
VLAEGSLWLIIAAGVLGGRIGFVARYWQQYADEPWRVPDLRDGGMEPVAAFSTAIVAASVLAWRRLDQRRAIVSAVWAGLFIWIGGNGLIRETSGRQALPTVTLTDLDGHKLPLAALAGKPMVVNLWASWCPPCRREMPALGKAQQDSPDLQFVFVNQGEDAATVRAYLAGEGLRLRHVVLDPEGALARAAGAPGLPTTLFFDASGMLVDKRMGEVSPATLAEYLAALRSKR